MCRPTDKLGRNAENRIGSIEKGEREQFFTINHVLMSDETFAHITVRQSLTVIFMLCSICLCVLLLGH